MNLTVTPGVFARLDLGWLVVDGVPFGTSQSTFPNEPERILDRPPSDLVVLVNEKCETCGDSDDPGEVIWPGSGCMTRCDDCHGTGSELLTVETGCEWCGDDEAEHLSTEHASLLGCTNGTRSKLVRLAGQPLPIVAGIPYPDGDPCIAVLPTEALWIKGGGERAERINLGSDSAALIGKWAFPVEVTP